MHRWCRSALRRMLGCAVVAAAADFAASGENAPLPPIHVLIISGQNNHAWEPTLARMRETCERTGRFRLTVNTSPQTMGPDDLRRVRVVLSHWNAWGDAPVRQWSPEARSGLLDFVQRGGGHVAVHAGSSSFYDWPEYHAMAGAAWALGRTGHGPVQAFRVTVAAPDHPITRGIVGFWTVDELWHRTGITPGVTVLATGFSDALRGGTGNEEPVAVCGAYGQGRTMALLLGHDARAMANAGFESLLTRGLEWAAGGEVSLPPSPELPASAAAARLASADLKGLLEAVAGYRFGMDRGDLLELEVLAADAGTGSESRGAFARTVAEALPKAASAEARIGLCRVLSLVGTAAEISVLETMLGDPDLHLAACEALQRIPGPEATAALVRALSRGDATDAMVAAHALAARRDPEAVPALAELLGDTRNADLAAAAARALGDIGGGAATEAVLAWATDTPAPHRSVAADALLRCETALRAAADRARLERLYGVLAQEGWPRSAREAALAGQLALLPPEQRSLALAQALRAADPLHFAAAVRYLREHGGAEDLTAAAAGLWALDDAWRREMLAVLLAERRHRPAQAGLLRCLDLVGDADIAPFCAALAVLGDATAVAGLCAAGVRTQAPQVLEALALLSGPGVEDALRKRLGSADPAVVVLVLRALISRRCGAAAPDLLPLLRHPSADVRIAALKALGELGGEAEVPTLLDDMRQARLRQETEEAARALAAIGMRAAERETFAARILEAARGAEPDIAAGLLGAAGALHAECVLPALEEALRAPAAELRRGACKSLSQWPTAAPLPALLAAAREASDPGERVLVLRGLAAVAGRPSPPAGVDPVAALGEALARSERGDTTGALLAALTMHPGLPALRLACDSLDRRPEAKEEALHAALTIAETALGSLSGEARAEARVLVARLEASAAASPELAARAKAVGLALHRPPNLARRGTASSPDGIEKDGAAGGDQAGIDGNPETYWDEENGKPEYRYRVTFPEPVDASAIRIVAWKHHEYAPKDFAIVCDDRVVHTVRGASYRDNEFWVPFPRTRLTWLELRITAYYAHSPAIRELGIYDGEAAPPATAAGKSAAAPDEPPEPRFSWQELPTSLALHNRDRVVWRFNAGAEDSKPCFHPLGLLDGTPLSAFRPDDHPWHRGLWFSWKLLNGVNYWEEDPRTGKSKGESRIVRCRAQAGSPFPARLDLELEYAPEGSAPILGEQRAIVVSVPDSRGCYRLHWDGLFTALAEPVRLDRTPIPGEPGGVAHGGYAGLSYRASLAPATWTVTDSEGRTGMELHRRQARWADFLCTGGEAGATGGVAILDHPANPRHPTPWFVVLNPAGRFGFLNPAPLCLEPLTLAPGEAMRLRYCVLVHPGALTREEIEAVWQDFAK